MNKMKSFNYDVVKLINSVKERPCLWDKTIEVYKDRNERKAAWKEVFVILEKNYESMSEAQKKTTQNAIMYKWINTRDAFLKSLKKMSTGKCRKYVFYHQLEFLKRILKYEESQIEDTDTSYSIDPEASIKYEEHNSDTTFFGKCHWDKSNKRSYDEALSEAESVDNEPYTIKPKPAKKTRDEQAVSDVSFVDVDQVNDSRLMNEDEAFFASLLPTIVRYNEDERLEFRMDVLRVMKKIKDKRTDHLNL